MLELRFQFGDHGAVGFGFLSTTATLLQLFHIAIQTLDDVLVVADLLLLGTQVFLTEEFIKNDLLIVHRWDGNPTVIPRAPPTAVVNAEREVGEAGITTQLAGEDLVERNRVREICCFGCGRPGEEGFFRVVVTRFHPRVIEVLEDGHLVGDLHVFQVLRCGKITAFTWKEIRLVEPKRITNEDDAFRWSGWLRFCGGVQIQ